MFNLETISPKMLDYYVNRPGALIIDLRDAEDYEKGHIKGAVNMPYEENSCMIPPPGKVLILYCERGNISMTVAREWAKRGNEVRTVIGGLHAYQGRYLVAGHPST